MKLYSFTETLAFTRWVVRHMSYDEYLRLQARLQANPEAGDVVQGCGGLRKVRVKDEGRGRGKRGGARVLYVFYRVAEHILMVDGYSKDQKTDITAEDKKRYNEVAREFEQTLARERRRGTGA